jgi:hypothetical protein
LSQFGDALGCHDFANLEIVIKLIGRRPWRPQSRDIWVVFGGGEHRQRRFEDGRSGGCSFGGIMRAEILFIGSLSIVQMYRVQYKNINQKKRFES